MSNYQEIGAVGHFLSSILFILSLQSLTNLKHALKGFYFAIFGVGLAIIMTIYR